jgi:hypothetical protein
MCQSLALGGLHIPLKHMSFVNEISSYCKPFYFGSIKFPLAVCKPLYFGSIKFPFAVNHFSLTPLNFILLSTTLFLPHYISSCCKTTLFGSIIFPLAVNHVILAPLNFLLQ